MAGPGREGPELAAASALTGRAAAMARSLHAMLRSGGSPRGARERVVGAFALAMQRRVESLADDRHPAYLHPGRSVLVLLRDVGALDDVPLSVAALAETEDDALATDLPAIERALGARVEAGVAAVPKPGDERLTERLVGLERELALAALAERLDQLRHLHLRADLRALWADRHGEVERVWLPFAERTHPRLATRYAHWARTFARRL